MSAIEPFWPTTTEQFDTFDRVANAALAEVGLADKYRLWVEADGLVQCNPAWGDDSDERMLTRAVTLGWDAMKLHYRPVAAHFADRAEVTGGDRDG